MPVSPREPLHSPSPRPSCYPPTWLVSCFLTGHAFELQPDCPGRLRSSHAHSQWIYQFSEDSSFIYSNIQAHSPGPEKGRWQISQALDESGTRSSEFLLVGPLELQTVREQRCYLQVAWPTSRLEGRLLLQTSPAPPLALGLCSGLLDQRGLC